MLASSLLQMKEYYYGLSTTARWSNLASSMWTTARSTRLLELHSSATWASAIAGLKRLMR